MLLISWAICIFLSIHLLDLNEELHLLDFFSYIQSEGFIEVSLHCGLYCRLTREPDTFLLSSVKSWGLSLRSLVNHKALEECSFRPVLWQFIMKLLFSTVCFLLRKLGEGLISFPAAFWPRKEAASAAAVFVKMLVCLWTDVVWNFTIREVPFNLCRGVAPPQSCTRNLKLWSCFGYAQSVWTRADAPSCANWIGTRVCS